MILAGEKSLQGPSCKTRLCKDLEICKVCFLPDLLIQIVNQNKSKWHLSEKRPRLGYLVTVCCFTSCAFYCCCLMFQMTAQRLTDGAPIIGPASGEAIVQRCQWWRCLPESCRCMWSPFLAWEALTNIIRIWTTRP